MLGIDKGFGRIKSERVNGELLSISGRKIFFLG